MPPVVEEQFSNDASTTLSAAISTTGQTSISVTSASGFPALAQFRIRIGTEIMVVTGGAGTTSWTVTRAQEGTVAATHLSGATIEHVLTAEALRRWNSNYLSQPRHNKLVCWTGPAENSIQGGTAGTGGVAYLHRFYVPETITVATFMCYVSTAGATLTANQNQVGIYNSAGTLLGRHANVATDFQSVGFKTFTLTAEAGQSLTLAPGVYHYAILMNGTTRPVFRSMAVHTEMINAGLVAADVFRCGSQANSYTALPATISLTTMGNSGIASYWAASS